jgi:hypothetical protein
MDELTTTSPTPTPDRSPEADAPAEDAPCCDATRKANCCEPAAKPACCGPSGAGKTGCC